MTDTREGGTSPGAPRPAAPVIRLSRICGVIHVLPREDAVTEDAAAAAPHAGGTLFEPFALPPIPLSMHCWLAGLGAEFRRRHRRCIAALLVLDCAQRRWLPPVLPSQACREEGASWTLDVGDVGPLPPNRRFAGSFQMRVGRDMTDAVSGVPQLDGVHVVQTVSRDAAVGEDGTAYY